MWERRGVYRCFEVDGWPLRWKLLRSVPYARMQIQTLGSLHLVNVISIHRPAPEAHLVILSLRAAVWPRKTMPTKPLKNSLEECEHNRTSRQNAGNFLGQRWVVLKADLPAGILHTRHREAQSVIPVTQSTL